MSLNIPTEDRIPEIDNQKIKKMAKEIEIQAEDLSMRLDRLKDRLQDSKDKYEDEAALAEEKHEAGRVYLNEADKLLASVHAAQQRAKGDRNNIDKLFKKSQHLVDVIKNYFADTNGDNISDDIDLDGITVDSIDRKSDALSDRIESYRTNVADMTTQAQNAFEDAADTLKTAEDNLEMANTVDSETTKLQDSIRLDQEKLNEKDRSSFERKFKDKSDEVEQKYAESKQIASMADNAREQVDTLALNLDSIEALLAEIKDRKLIETVDEISKTFDDSNMRDNIQKQQNEYKKRKDSFEAQKAASAERVAEFERELAASLQHLHKNQKLEKTLESEVERLNQIHKALPNWCKKSSKTNENGAFSSASSSSSNSASLRDSITEQT
ncbi:unnamed protein product [Oikopleura dioica]|nr:unnamed protein product [Oikopleura dioica]